MTNLDDWTVSDRVICTVGDRVVGDRDEGVYRIKTAAGVLVGTEYGGPPRGYESRDEAEEALARRQGLAEDLRHFRENRWHWGWPS